MKSYFGYNTTQPSIFNSSQDSSFYRTNKSRTRRSSSIRKKLDSLMSRCQARAESIKKARPYSSVKENSTLSRTYEYFPDTREHGTQTRVRNKACNQATQTERVKKESASEFSQDAEFIQFLKTVSLYCQNDLEDECEDVADPMKGYQRLHLNLRYLKETFQKYKEIQREKSRPQSRIIDYENDYDEDIELSERITTKEYKRAIEEDLASSPAYSTSRKSQYNTGYNSTRKCSYNDCEPYRKYLKKEKQTLPRGKNTTVSFINDMYNKLFTH